MGSRLSLFLFSWLLLLGSFVLLWFILDLFHHSIHSPLYWIASLLLSLLIALLFSLFSSALIERSLRSLATDLDKTLGFVRSERDLLNAVLEGMDEGVLVTDRAGQVMRTNAALRKWLELKEEVIGKELSEVWSDPNFNRTLTEARLQGEVQRTEIVLDEKLHLVGHIAPLSRAEGGAVVVFHDVTELRRLERVRRDFVANVSHELRTPIAAIRGAADTLLDGGIDDQNYARRFLEVIARHASRLADILSDLLELSRLESSGQRLDEGSLDLAALAKEALQERAEAFSSRNLSFTLDAPPKLPLAAGDPRAVRRILGNLLENAIHYTEPGGKISIKLSSENEWVHIGVSDTGIGIAPHHLPRIFERFYRADAGRSRAQGGTGLGLSIVRHLVQAMNGEISVESTPGKGTTFRVSLQRQMGNGEWGIGNGE